MELNRSVNFYKTHVNPGHESIHLTIKLNMNLKCKGNKIVKLSSASGVLVNVFKLAFCPS